MVNNINKIIAGNGNYPEDYQKILKHVANYKVPFTTTKEDAFNNLMAKIDSGKTVQMNTKNSKHRIIYWAASVAASILLFFGIWQFINYMQVERVEIAKGQHSEYKLPDGSLVFLNAESKMSFNKKNFLHRRTLNLEGEAFFSIRKGSTFTIKTKVADINILGTSFNVYARSEGFKVACVTGKVQVISGSQQVVLTPGQSAVVNNTTLEKNIEKNIETVADWRSGEFYFENTSLNLIFHEIERQFNVTFVLPDINGKFFTGNFNNKNLVEALDIVCIPMGLTYEIGRNSQIFIHPKN